MFFVYRAIKKKKKTGNKTNQMPSSYKICGTNICKTNSLSLYPSLCSSEIIFPSLFFFFFFISHELSIFTDCIKQDLGR